MFNIYRNRSDILYYFFIIILFSSLLFCSNANAQDKKREIFDACKNGDIEMVKRLLDEGISIGVRDNHNNTLLDRIADSDHIDLIKFLLKKGIEIDAIAPKTRIMSESRTALMRACAAGKLENVKLLVENGAEIDKESPHTETALILAIEKGDLGIVKYLLEKGADAGKRYMADETPFTVACGKGNLAQQNCCWNTIREFVLKGMYSVEPYIMPVL